MFLLLRLLALAEPGPAEAPPTDPPPCAEASDPLVDELLALLTLRLQGDEAADAETLATLTRQREAFVAKVDQALAEAPAEPSRLMRMRAAAALHEVRLVRSVTPPPGLSKKEAVAWREVLATDVMPRIDALEQTALADLARAEG